MRHFVEQHFRQALRYWLISYSASCAWTQRVNDLDFWPLTLKWYEWWWKWKFLLYSFFYYEHCVDITILNFEPSVDKREGMYIYEYREQW